MADSERDGPAAGPPRALEGLRALDLATGSFGYAGKLLAGLGAEVIKVEPHGGDPLRMEPPFPNDEPDPERGGRHLHLSTGKLSVTLNLDHAEGQVLLRRLVRECDILIESFPPGHMAERGVAYDDLVRERPDLVMASITHFGQDGPYAGDKGSELIDYALGGYLMVTGDPDREPVKSYDNLVEQQAALHAATAVMVGLFHRDATGEGDHFDVSATDAALFLIGGPAQEYYSTGQVVKRRGTRLMFNSPRLFYPSTIRPCKDGYVHVHTNVRHPDLMSVLMDEPRLNAPDIMETPLGHADEIDELMDQWLIEHDKFEVVRRAQDLRLPFTEVLTPEEILQDDHLEERGFFVDVQHPAAGTIRQPGAPATLTGTPWRTVRAPLLGEHNEAIYMGLLAMKPEEITALAAAGVI